MILGLGSDLIEIARVEKAAREERFLARTFTEEERRQSGETWLFSPAVLLSRKRS